MPMSKQASPEYHRRYREANIERRRVWNREWIANNRERYNAAKYHYREKCKMEALIFYSNGAVCCKYCGFDQIDALVLDHINDDGAAHRKAIGIAGRGSAGMNTYEALKREGYPDGLQVLCANCNLTKEMKRKQAKRLENPHYTPMWVSEYGYNTTL